MRVSSQRVERRRLLLSMAAFAIAPRASAQSATAAALDDFARYVDAAVAIFGEFALGLRNADARAIRGESARQVLREVQVALRNQAMSNVAVVDALRQYRDFARRVAAEPEGASAEQVASRHEGIAQSWAEARTQVGETAEVVRRVAAIVDASTALSGVLTAEQQIALRDTLAMREVVLARLADLPAPISADELARLDHFISRYNALIRVLARIRVELHRAIEGEEQ